MAWAEGWALLSYPVWHISPTFSCIGSKAPWPITRNFQKLFFICLQGL